ncbi:MAG: DNA-processing protein DprA [Pirellulaceae bacterium]
MLPGLGPRTLATLLEHFHSPRAVLGASEQVLAEVPGVGTGLIHKIRHAGDYVDVDAILAWCAAADVELLTIDRKSYPRPLRDLCDAPPILFCKGSVEQSDELAVSIVGTRHATRYGLRQAERIAYGLARAGITIVSGLARGIDAAAHRGALDAGGRTIAVLGGGLREIYPAEHEDLAKTIAKNGAVLSEFRPDARPRGGMFPQRNRLVSGLAMAVLVVEAPQRSGALITARLAGEQGRDVYALPGQVTARASEGCHQLLRDGATLVRSADDILEDLGPVAAAVPTDDGRQLRNGAELLLNEQERAVLDAIETECTSIDSVVTTSQLPVHRVLATISVLESRKLVRRLSGQYVARA